MSTARSAACSVRILAPPGWLFLLMLCFPLPAFAQTTPLLTVDQDCVTMAYAPDGRLVYATKRMITFRRIEMRRDDIWLIGLDGKRKRIVDGERLVGRGTPYSYAIQSIRWAPDGARMTVEMLTSYFIDSEGNTKDGSLTLLLDETGKEIKIQGADSVIEEAWNAAWLGDGVTVGYLAEAVKPKLLFSLNTVRPIAGRGGPVAQKSVFVSVAWDAKRGAAAAIERDAQLKGPPRLVWVDALKETHRDLAVLDAYLGQLSVSPSGTKVAYFRDNETLEIREVAQPEKATRVRVVYGTYVWSPDETRILIRRGVDRKRDSDLTWVTLPAAGSPSTATAETPRQQALHGLMFREFALSPDGTKIAVLEPGKKNLVIYPAQ